MESVSNCSVQHGYICVVFKGGTELLFSGSRCGERQDIQAGVACTVSILLVEILMVFKYLHSSSDNV